MILITILLTTHIIYFIRDKRYSLYIYYIKSHLINARSLFIYSTASSNITFVTNSHRYCAKLSKRSSPYCLHNRKTPDLY